MEINSILACNPKGVGTDKAQTQLGTLRTTLPPSKSLFSVNVVSSLSSGSAALLSRDRQATVSTPRAHPEEAGRKAPISEDPTLLCSTPHPWGHELAVPQFPHLRVTEWPSSPPRVPGTLAFQVTGQAGLFLCRSSSTASSALHLGKHSAPF